MKPAAPFHTLPLAAAFLLLMAVAGCDRDNVKVYKVDSNDTAVTPPAATPAAIPATMPGDLPAPDNSGLPRLQFTLPAGWKEKALTQLRVASFEISENGKTADVSAIPLSGMAGGNLANVNRWRGQVGLSPLPETDLQKLAEKVEVAGQAADLYDVAGVSPGSGEAERILAVIFHRNDTAWFFKMTGAADLVEKNKPAFVSLLKTVHFGEPSVSPAMDASQLPPSHPAIPGMNMPGAASLSADAVAKPTWTVPDGWQEGELAQFLIARYVIKGSGAATATVNVSQLAGDGGGLLANVNRWRKQLGVAQITEADLAKLATMDVSGAKATLVEISGTDPRSGQPAGLVGVVLPLGGQTWFYKLTGDAGVVAAQKAALIQFVASAKYPLGQ